MEANGERRAATSSYTAMIVALIGDAIFEVVCGFACLLAGATLAYWFGVSSTLILVIGVLLLIAAIVIGNLARSPNKRLIQTVAVINMVCGVALIFLALLGAFPTGEGQLVGIIVALFLILFGVPEWSGASALPSTP